MTPSFTTITIDDDERGQAFHSKFFPSLKYFVHLGPEVETGKHFHPL